MKEISSGAIPPDRDGRELELKLETGIESLELLRRHPLLMGASTGTRAMQSIYYDSKKAALRGAGLTLRVRRSGNGFVQTIKAGRTASVGLFDRAEWEEPIAGMAPDLSLTVGTPLEPLLAHNASRKALRPVFETAVERQSWIVHHKGAEVEVILDAGEVIAGDLRQPLVELELELKKGRAGALFSLARAFQKSVPLRLGVLSKSEQGFRLARKKAARPAKAEAILVEAGMAVAEGFQAIAYACIRQFRLNEPLLLASGDAEALHQARVALRRLRSALSIFKSRLAGERFEHFRSELRWLSGVLGHVRDLDVFIAGQPKPLSATDRDALRVERERALDRAAETLDSSRARLLMIELVEWIATGAWLDASEGNARLGDLARSTLTRSWKKVRKGGGALANLDDEGRHDLRIAAKKLRYAIEFFAALSTEKRAEQRRAFLAALKRLQTNLGDLNDIVTGGAIVRKLSEGLGLSLSAPPTTARKEARLRKKLIASAEAAFDDLSAAPSFWK